MAMLREPDRAPAAGGATAADAARRERAEAEARVKARAEVNEQAAIAKRCKRCGHPQRSGDTEAGVSGTRDAEERRRRRPSTARQDRGEYTKRRQPRHGHARRDWLSPEYRAWRSMRQRCSNPKRRDWPNYGGRGIRVCDRWNASFAAFLADIGPCPSAGHTLDRHPNKDGDYAPGNVRWATRTQQNRNKRTNRLIAHDGHTLTLAEWAERTGIGLNTIRKRLKHGWSTADAMTTPPRRRAQNRGPICHNGRTMSLTDWSREGTLSANTIATRLARGWSTSEAITRPLQSGHSAAFSVARAPKAA